MRKKSITLNSAPNLTKRQRKELEALARMPDEQIDFSDIPEMKLDHPWRRRAVYIEADVLDWLRAQDKDLSIALSRVLRPAMDLSHSTSRRRRRRSAA
jgi:uncharacterized protein (DUF4415 family)